MVFGFIFIFIGVLIILLQHPLFGSAPKGKLLEKIKRSKNYRNVAFQNLNDTPALSEDATYFGLLKDYFFTKYPNTKPESDVPHDSIDVNKISSIEDFFIWFGHSSYYLQIDQKKMLVDPVFSGNASPIYNTNPSFSGTDVQKAENLPNIDLLIITHDHYDHLDYQTIKKIKDKVSKVVCPLGVSAHLILWGIPSEKIVELDWYDSIEISENIKITATPARHFSGRLFKRNQTLWASYVLKTPNQNIYIGGDSGFDDHFEQIGQQFGPFDIAFLENGQYNKGWKYIHMFPDETLKAAQLLQTKNLMAVHYGKFKLANHPWYEPIETLDSLCHQQKDLNLLTPRIGQMVFLNNENQFEKWWKK